MSPINWLDHQLSLSAKRYANYRLAVFDSQWAITPPNYAIFCIIYYNFFLYFLLKQDLEWVYNNIVFR